ncbi:MAG TPA: Holliday junction resolvase Hjc [Methanothermobacter sp.]|nr:predicted archaeal holliday junction resolvase [Methanothermobacter sp. MT-2]HHW04862.1 Holliday junction resolvase [Methanothermobacter sp.]HOK72161.1 Holliday junction resolvase Hjc [Methanothermobacter sp.]HOL68474.1 Holliday junction resolvase Hjc [Methanothermobacter sp.]HPQ04233.1 Holliday junction resolvase Hjc [Methanothermobacter sp.]
MVRKGYKEEVDLVKIFWDNGFAAIRAPASGGATKKPLPDVIAGNGERYLAIEVKTTSKDRIYIDSKKIEGLLKFSKIFGAKPYIGVKFKYKKWFFLPVDDLEITVQKNYKIDLELALRKGLDIYELIGKEKQIKFK